MSTLAALKKLEEQLKCAICLEDYKDPKVLQCFHVFCQNCLGHRRMVVQNEVGGRSLHCPTCRQATPIPPSGVSGLQSAFHINHLLEIQESLKKSKDSASSEREGGESNITTPSKRSLSTVLSMRTRNWNSFVKRVRSSSAQSVALEVETITVMNMKR